jgi:hypothetical protein
MVLVKLENGELISINFCCYCRRAVVFGVKWSIPERLFSEVIAEVRSIRPDVQTIEILANNRIHTLEL